MATYGWNKQYVTATASDGSTIIDMNQTQDSDLPKEAALLYKTGMAYWNTNGDEYKENAIRAFCALYRYRLQDQYPKAGYYIAYWMRKRQETEIYGVEVRACVAHMSRYYILTAQEIGHIQDAIMMYLYYRKDGWDQVIQWLRERVESDRQKRTEPIGLSILRHYLMLGHFISVEKNLLNAAFYKYLAEKFLVREAMLQCACCQFFENLMEGGEHSTQQVRDWLVRDAYNGNALANQILYGVSIDRIPYEYDRKKTSDNNVLWSYEGGPYSEYYYRYKKACPALQKEVASLRDGWYDREVSKAKQTAELAVSRYQKRHQISEWYARALYQHALGNTKEALELMCQVQASDASFNSQFMDILYFYQNLSPAASWWLSQHSKGLYDHNRQYGFDQQGNFTRLDTSQVRYEAWARFQLWNEADVLADEVNRQPSPAGFRKLAKLVGQSTCYWEPLTELSQEIREDLLRKYGMDELVEYLLDESINEYLQIANALRYDPQVNRGDESRIEAGWLTILNHHYQWDNDGLEEALRYVNQFFDYPKALGSNHLNIRYVTEMAAKGDEAALHVLGRLYLDFEEVHHGSEARRNVGRFFYNQLYKHYQEQKLSLNGSDKKEKEKELLRKQYRLEYEDRRDERSDVVDTICRSGIMIQDVFFFPMIVRPNVFDYFMKNKGRIWVKTMLYELLKHGCESVRELYNKMDAEDEARERARMAAEAYERRRREAEEAKEEERRRQKFNERMDELERLGDVLGGGTGMTNEEKMNAGQKSFLDYLRDKNLRDSLPDWLW